MIVAPSLALRGDLLHIRLTKPSERTNSGLWLPSARQVKATEGKVLATGPGRLLENGKRAFIWVAEGDVVLFPEHALQRFGVDNEGWISAEHLLATVSPDDRLYPEGEWVLLDPDPAPSTTGLIHLSDRAQRLPRSGVIRDTGPGELRLKGPLAGLRWTCRAIMNLGLEEAIIDRRAYWQGETEEAHAAGQVLVKARDLICLEEES